MLRQAFEKEIEAKKTQQAILKKELKEQQEKLKKDLEQELLLEQEVQRKEFEKEMEAKKKSRSLQSDAQKVEPVTVEEHKYESESEESVEPVMTEQQQQQQQYYIERQQHYTEQLQQLQQQQQQQQQYYIEQHQQLQLQQQQLQQQQLQQQQLQQQQQQRKLQQQQPQRQQQKQQQQQQQQQQRRYFIEEETEEKSECELQQYCAEQQYESEQEYEHEQEQKASSKKSFTSLLGSSLTNVSKFMKGSVLDINESDSDDSVVVESSKPKTKSSDKKSKSGNQSVTQIGSIKAFFEQKEQPRQQPNKENAVRRDSIKENEPRQHNVQRQSYGTVNRRDSYSNNSQASVRNGPPPMRRFSTGGAASEYMSRQQSVGSVSLASGNSHSSASSASSDKSKLFNSGSSYYDRVRSIANTGTGNPTDNLSVKDRFIAAKSNEMAQKDAYSTLRSF